MGRGGWEIFKIHINKPLVEQTQKKVKKKKPQKYKAHKTYEQLYTNQGDNLKENQCEGSYTSKTEWYKGIENLNKPVVS